MPVDSLTLAAALTEARPLLVGSRLLTLSQPDKAAVSLSGRTDGKPWHWLVDLHDGVARAHLSRQPIAKGLATPWVQQCRKHVEGARIVDVVQEPWERVLHVRLAGRDALGDPRTYRLTFEIMGRYSLAALVDEATGTIVATTRVVDETMSRLRQIAPGLPYALPPKPDRPSLAECDDAALQSLLVSAAAPWSGWLAKTFAGLAKERVGALSEGLPEEPAAARSVLAARLAAWREAWRQGHWHWDAAGEPRAMPGEGRLAGLNESLDRFYRSRLEADALARIKRQLTTAIEQAQGRVGKQLDELNLIVAERGEVERLQQEAELLQANLYRIPTGAEAVPLENYFLPDYPTVTLVLDPHLQPAENVQVRFRQAQKAARRLAHAETQREDVAAQAAFLDETAYYVAAAEALSDLQAVTDDLQRQGIIKTTTERRAFVETGPERYRSGDGLEILVGRNGRQNEQILAVARSHEFWLHAQYIPGAHVLVRSPKGSQVPTHTLEEAANLAAYFSKSRHAAHVPVVAVPRRFVRQPKGAPPGFVHYTNEDVIVASPAFDQLPAKISDGL